MAIDNRRSPARRVAPSSRAIATATAIKPSGPVASSKRPLRLGGEAVAAYQGRYLRLLSQQSPRHPARREHRRQLDALEEDVAGRSRGDRDADVQRGRRFRSGRIAENRDVETDRALHLGNAEDGASALIREPR